MNKKRNEFKEIIKKMSTEELVKILFDRIQKGHSENDTEQESSTEKSNIKEELKTKKLYSGYLEGFEKEFETHLELTEKETPILIQMTRDFLNDVYQPSKLYLLAAEAKGRIHETLLKTLNEEQKLLLEQFEYCLEVISEDLTDQSFIYGYAMNEQMKNEAINKYKLKK